MPIGEVEGGERCGALTDEPLAVVRSSGAVVGEYGTDGGGGMKLAGQGAMWIGWNRWRAHCEPVSSERYGERGARMNLVMTRSRGDEKGSLHGTDYHALLP